MNNNSIGDMLENKVIEMQKEDKENKKISFQKKKAFKYAMITLIFLVLISVLVFCLIFFFREKSKLRDYEKPKQVLAFNSDGEEKKEDVIDVASLKKENPDLDSWIRTEDKSFSSYVMKDSSYVKKDFGKKFYFDGSAYVDRKISGVFRSIITNDAHNILNSNNKFINEYHEFGYYKYKKVLEFNISNLNEFKREVNKDNTYNGVYNLLKIKYGLPQDYDFKFSPVLIFVSNGKVTNLNEEQKVLVYALEDSIDYAMSENEK